MYPLQKFFVKFRLIVFSKIQRCLFKMIMYIPKLNSLKIFYCWILFKIQCYQLNFYGIQRLFYVYFSDWYFLSIIGIGELVITERFFFYYVIYSESINITMFINYFCKFLFVFLLIIK